MLNRLRRINDALPGLVAGIILYAAAVQLTGVWFVRDKLGYSVGLWFGAFVAVGLAINIATVILDSVTLDGGSRAATRIIVKSVLRYLVVAALFLLFGYLKLGNLLTAFLGVLGLKVSAYMQPLLGKLGKMTMTQGWFGESHPNAPGCEETEQSGNNLSGRGDAASGDEI